MSIKPTQAQIAEALEIDAAMVTRYKARGMPVDSIESARSWKLANVRPRISTPRRPSQPHPAVSSGAACAVAEQLMDASSALLDAIGDITPFVPALRAALAAVPKSERASMLLHVKVMDVLTSHVMDRINREQLGIGDPGGSAYGAEMSDEEAAWMGAFWYSVAAGEIRLAAGV